MIAYLQKTFALSERGARDLVRATLACAAANIVLMFPVSLLYMLSGDLMAGDITGGRVALYAASVAILMAAIYATKFVQYNATFFSTYRESGVKRIGIAEKLRRLPLSFFGQRDLSDLTTAILGDCAATEHAFSHYIPEFFGSILSTCLVAIGLLVYDARMALSAVWVLPLSLLIVVVSIRVQDRFNFRKNDAVLACTEGIQECMETMRDLRANRADASYLKGLDRKIDAIEHRSIQSELGVAQFVVSAQMLLKFGIATTALTGSRLLIAGELSVLRFFLFLLVAGRIYEPMAGSLINLAAIVGIRANIRRQQEIENHPIQTGSTTFRPKGYDIAFEHVSFSYNEGETVLRDVSFTAKQGEVTALIGPSGGGKSTAAKLAARFWDTSEGRITLGGVDVKSVDPEALLSAFSIVFQDVTLFNNTVMENIRIGRSGATDAQVLEAARLARCDEFVSRLPAGYDTQIGENGAALSGGERQRISIARALLKDAPVILLDEATASLDAENEAEIQQAISQLVRGKTVLIIAHRLRTVEDADKLIFLQNGSVAEQGTPGELLQSNGPYAHMRALQREIQ